MDKLRIGLLGLVFLAVCSAIIVKTTTTEGEPLHFKESFLLEGENTMSTLNPKSLPAYARDVGQDVSDIKSIHPKDIQVEVTDMVADKLLIKEFTLMVTAMDKDTLSIAGTNELRDVNKHPLKLKNKNELLPYFKADQFEWLLKCKLQEDYEELLPLKVTMALDITHK